MLRRLTRGDMGLADDLAQETFVLAWRNLRHFRFEARFSTWIYRIAFNAWQSEARKKHEVLLDLDDDAAACRARMATTRCPTWRRAWTSSARMATLSDGERAAITACYYADLSHEEAALALGTPVGHREDPRDARQGEAARAPRLRRRNHERPHRQAAARRRAHPAARQRILGTRAEALPARAPSQRTWLRPALIFGSAALGSVLAIVLAPAGGSLLQGFADLVQLRGFTPAAITAVAMGAALLLSALVLAVDSE